jgi:hypothetical protein
VRELLSLDTTQSHEFREISSQLAKMTKTLHEAATLENDAATHVVKQTQYMKQQTKAVAARMKKAYSDIKRIQAELVGLTEQLAQAEAALANFIALRAALLAVPSRPPSPSGRSRPPSPTSKPIQIPVVAEAPSASVVGEGEAGRGTPLSTAREGEGPAPEQEASSPPPPPPQLAPPEPKLSPRGKAKLRKLTDQIGAKTAEVEGLYEAVRNTEEALEAAKLRCEYVEEDRERTSARMKDLCQEALIFMHQATFMKNVYFKERKSMAAVANRLLSKIRFVKKKLKDVRALVKDIRRLTLLRAAMVQHVDQEDSGEETGEEMPVGYNFDDDETEAKVSKKKKKKKKKKGGKKGGKGKKGKGKKDGGSRPSSPTPLAEGASRPMTPNPFESDSRPSSPSPTGGRPLKPSLTVDTSMGSAPALSATSGGAFTDSLLSLSPKASPPKKGKKGKSPTSKTSKSSSPKSASPKGSSSPSKGPSSPSKGSPKGSPKASTKGSSSPSRSGPGSPQATATAGTGTASSSSGKKSPKSPKSTLSKSKSLKGSSTSSSSPSKTSSGSRKSPKRELDEKIFSRSAILSPTTSLKTTRAARGLPDQFEEDSPRDEAEATTRHAETTSKVSGGTSTLSATKSLEETPDTLYEASIMKLFRRARRDLEIAKAKEAAEEEARRLEGDGEEEPQEVNPELEAWKDYNPDTNEDGAIPEFSGTKRVGTFMKIWARVRKQKLLLFEKDYIKEDAQDPFAFPEAQVTEFSAANLGHREVPVGEVEGPLEGLGGGLVSTGDDVGAEHSVSTEDVDLLWRSEGMRPSSVSMRSQGRAPVVAQEGPDPPGSPPSLTRAASSFSGGGAKKPYELTEALRSERKVVKTMNRKDLERIQGEDDFMQVSSAFGTVFEGVDESLFTKTAPLEHEVRKVSIQIEPVIAPVQAPTSPVAKPGSPSGRRVGSPSGRPASPTGRPGSPSKALSLSSLPQKPGSPSSNKPGSAGGGVRSTAAAEARWSGFGGLGGLGGLGGDGMRISDSASLEGSQSSVGLGRDLATLMEGVASASLAPRPPNLAQYPVDFVMRVETSPTSTRMSRDNGLYSEMPRDAPTAGEADQLGSQTSGPDAPPGYQPSTVYHPLVGAEGQGQGPAAAAAVALEPRRARAPRRSSLMCIGTSALPAPAPAPMPAAVEAAPQEGQEGEMQEGQEGEMREGGSAAGEGVVEVEEEAPAPAARRRSRPPSQRPLSSEPPDRIIPRRKFCGPRKEPARAAYYAVKMKRPVTGATGKGRRYVGIAGLRGQGEEEAMYQRALINNPDAMRRTKSPPLALDGEFPIKDRAAPPPHPSSHICFTDKSGISIQRSKDGVSYEYEYYDRSEETELARGEDGKEAEREPRPAVFWNLAEKSFEEMKAKPERRAATAETSSERFKRLNRSRPAIEPDCLAFHKPAPPEESRPSWAAEHLQNMLPDLSATKKKRVRGAARCMAPPVFLTAGLLCRSGTSSSGSLSVGRRLRPTTRSARAW